MEEITIEELKNDDAYNDYIDELLYEDYIKTDEYMKEERYEDIVRAMLDFQEKRKNAVEKLESVEEKYWNYLTDHKPNQETKETIYDLMELVDRANNEIYNLLEELEEL